MDGTGKDVFISYHMDSSTDIVEKISAALEGAGISSWYAKRDIEGGYAGAIIDAIESCRVFLLILNQYSSASAHCLNEINAVFDRLSRHENVVILPFRIDSCQLSKDAYYYLGRIRMFDGSLPPEAMRVRELVDRISLLLGRESAVEGFVNEGALGTGKRYRIVGSAVSRSSGFVGRKKELETIYELLGRNPKKVFLVGMGGIGKSEIAKAYCDAYRDSYDVILWVSFEGSLKKTVISDFAFPIEGLERGDYPREDDETYFQRKLKVLNEIADQRVLIVFDNFDVLSDEDLEIFCRGRYSVLFTTRYHEVCEDVPELAVGEFTDERELLEIFQNEYKKKLEGSAAGQVKELLGILKGHPLSIRLVASAMRSSRMSPDKMLALLKKDTQERKKENARAYEQVFGRLRQVFLVSALTEEEQRVLKNLALMPLGGIDVEIFYEWCGFEDYDVIDGLIQKSWVIHDPAADEVHLHPLVTDIMLEELAGDPGCCEQLLSSLKEGTVLLTTKGFELKKKYYECLASASSRLPESHPGKGDAAYSYARMIFEMSWYDEAMDRLRALWEKTEDLTRQLAIYNQIAHGYCLSGRTREGIEEAEKGLRLIEGRELLELTKEQRAQRRNLYTRLSEAYRNLGRYDLTEGYLKKLIEEAECFPEENSDADFGWLYLHLGRVLSYKGTREDWQESGQAFEKCLRLFEGDAQSQGYVYMFYGQLRMFEGDYEEALRMNEMALERMLPGLGGQHIDIGKLKLFEANILRAAGEEEKARACYLKAVEMLNQRKNPMLAERVREILESGKIGYTN